MRVLVACEWSNTVRDAFLAHGHDAYSCDLERAEHPNPNWRRHIRGDVRPLLKEKWDLVIAHPPCTYLCNSGVWLYEREWETRSKLLVDAAVFFWKCLEANADRVCVENPIMHNYAKAAVRVKPTQIIQPWQFGHPVSKATCLYLRNLEPLKPTDVVKNNGEYIQNKLGSEKSQERSRTFPGIARAMAEQWG